MSLCFFLLGGRYLDFKTRASARSAAQELSALEVPRALRVTATGEEFVAAADAELQAALDAWLAKWSVSFIQPEMFCRQRNAEYIPADDEDAES